MAENLMASNDVIYDNTENYSNSDTVQGAIDELYDLTSPLAPLYKNIRIVDNTIYYGTEEIGSHPIYFNVNTGEKCNVNEYESNIDNLGNKGCMKFYAYSENSDDTVNMILDHNITNESPWISKEDYEKNDANSLGVTYGSEEFSQYGGTKNNEDQRKGPLSTLRILKDETSSWSDDLKVNINYSVDIINKENQKIQYTINYSDYKARLISAEEVAIIIGADKPLEENGLNFNINNVEQGNIYLDGGRTNDPTWRTKISNSYCTWLFDNTNGCQKFGCNYNPDVNGYWSSSPIASSKSAWGVGGSAMLCSGGEGIKVGIRPVVTVSKGKIK